MVGRGARLWDPRTPGALASTIHKMIVSWEAKCVIGRQCGCCLNSLGSGGGSQCLFFGTSRLDVFRGISDSPASSLGVFPDAAGIDEPGGPDRSPKWMARSPKPRWLLLARVCPSWRGSRFTPIPRSLRTRMSSWDDFALAERGGELGQSGAKAVLGLGMGRRPWGTGIRINALRFAWMTQRILTRSGPSSPTVLRLLRRWICNRATLQAETCRCKWRRPEFHFCTFRYVRARRSMRASRAWEIVHVTPRLRISKSSLCLYSRASRRTMRLRCTVECSDPASAFRRIRPQAPRVGHWAASLLRHNAVSADNASRLVNLQGVRMGHPGRVYIWLSPSRAGVLEGDSGRRRGRSLWQRTVLD